MEKASFQRKASSGKNFLKFRRFFETLFVEKEKLEKDFSFRKCSFTKFLYFWLQLLQVDHFQAAQEEIIQWKICTRQEWTDCIDLRFQIFRFQDRLFTGCVQDFNFFCFFLYFSVFLLFRYKIRHSVCHIRL